MASRLLPGVAMHTRASPPAKTVEVTIVSSNPETLDGLHSYLSAAGVVARCTRTIEDCLRVASESALAFVVFPDDFRWETVLAAVADLTENHPRALPVLVTAQPRRYEELFSGGKVLVVPRPVWGWAILDAIRAHLDRQKPNEAPRGRR